MKIRPVRAVYFGTDRQTWQSQFHIFHSVQYSLCTFVYVNFTKLGTLTVNFLQFRKRL